MTEDPRDYGLTAADLRNAADRLYAPDDHRLAPVIWDHSTQVRYGLIRSHLRNLADATDSDAAGDEGPARQVTHTAQVSLVQWNGPPEAVLCPVFLCTACQEPVFSRPSAGHEMSGYVIWWDYFSGDSRHQQLGPFIVHRLGCMRVLEHQIADLGDPRWSGPGLSRELGEFTVQLAHNTSQPFDHHDPDHHMVIPEGP